MKRLFISIALFSITHLANAQIGGRKSFDFINIPGDTRLAALGGVNVSLYDQDVNLFFSNPGLLNEQMAGFVSLNHAFYYGGINVSKFAYSHAFNIPGVWGIGFQNVNYGEMDAYDPSGNPIGEIKANDFMVMGSYARKIGNFSLGLNTRFAYSSIAGYHASAFLIDMGGVFIHPELDWTAGMNIRNVGLKLSDYTASSGSGIPFDLQLGTSFKPEHMPVRFSITGYNLYKGNILYSDKGADLFDGEPGLFQKLISHFNFGGEILISDNLNVRGGYNYLIRRELRLEQRSGGTGFSFGFMLRIKSFELSYSRAIYHVAGGINYFGISSDLKSFYRKS